jgi:hypothetical protein
MSKVPKYTSNAQRQAAYRRRRAQSEADKAQQAGLVPLPAISSLPGTIRWRQALAHAAFHVSTVRDEMQTYHDSRTERWQESDRATDFLERLALVEQIVEYLEEVQEQL